MKRQKIETKEKYNWIEIDLKALESNYNRIKELLPKGKKIMAVVKSDAYGHGLIAVSRKLASLGVDYFAVATIEEAVALRKAGIGRAILLLNIVLDSQIPYLFKYTITATVGDLTLAKILSSRAKRLRKYLKIHIEVDSGMGRCGIWHRQAAGVIEKIVGLPYLDVEGVYSHFSCADTDVDFTNKQVTNFRALLNVLKNRGITFRLTHISNSSGIVNFPNLEFNMVRPGLILYGLAWGIGLAKKLKLKPVMSFKARVVFLKEIDPGRPVSYGRTYIAKSKRLIATLAVGYADGYNRLLSNNAQVIVKGKRADVVGRVCMDHIMVDVTAIKDLKVADEVTLIGREGQGEISCEELAQVCKTIAYEIACSVSKRADRFYKY